MFLKIRREGLKMSVFVVAMLEIEIYLKSKLPEFIFKFALNQPRVILMTNYQNMNFRKFEHKRINYNYRGLYEPNRRN
jgi:hypothetical protein